MMKRLLIPLLLLIWGLQIRAEETRVLAQSPDEQFQLLLQAESSDDYGTVVVRNTKTGGTTTTTTGQGYSFFRDDDVDAYWKEDSSAFAVTLRGTKTTWHTEVYIKDGERWRKLEFPPFIANILGRQGVFSTGRNVNECFDGFEGESRFSLFCHVEPDWQQKEAADKFTEWRPSKQADWKVVLEYRRGTSPNCEIVSIEAFSEADESK